MSTGDDSSARPPRHPQPNSSVRTFLWKSVISMSFFDVRIPELKMIMVAADGQDVEPVTVDEFRIGAAEVPPMTLGGNACDDMPARRESTTHSFR
jgi:hypothetical protein